MRYFIMCPGITALNRNKEESFKVVLWRHRWWHKHYKDGIWQNVLHKLRFWCELKLWSNVWKSHMAAKCGVRKLLKQQETCRSIKLRELSACGRFVSHTKATEHKCRMTAHGPSSTSQLRRPRMLRCHCLPPGSLHVLGAFGSLSKSHISFKVT